MKRPHGGAADPTLLDFSANVNPLGPPEGVRLILGNAADLINRYPTPDARRFCSVVAHRHRISPECVLADSGASNLIYLLTRLFIGQRARVLVPAFTEYEDACESAGIPVNQGGETVTFLANPTSPEGRLISSEEILRLPGTLVIDEAFMEFADDRESLVIRAAEDFRLIVIRSLTKFYAIPGLRLAYLVAVPETVARLRNLQAPWSVNALAEAAGIAAFEDRQYADFTCRFVRERREELTQGLTDCGLEPRPSTACFVFCRVSDAESLCQGLLQHGIVARNCDSFTGIEKNRYVRFAVRKQRDNERLLTVLREIYEKCPV